MADQKRLFKNLDEVDKAIIRDLLARELVAIELEFPGSTLENTETLTRLRFLYAFFMRSQTSMRACPTCGGCVPVGK